MKLYRINAIITVIVLLFGSAALAENDFSLRNGIQFGDTMETILEKETTLVRSGADSTSFTGRIAGFDNATCDFSFDDNEKLVSMTYEFDCFSRETTNSNYKTLYQSLVRQYGKAQGNTGGSCELIMGPALTRMALWVYFLGEMDGCAADYYDYDEWIVDCTGYHVKVDLASYYYRNDDYEYSYYINLSYHKYTDDDYNAEKNKQNNERDEVDNDL